MYIERKHAHDTLGINTPHAEISSCKRLGYMLYANALPGIGVFLYANSGSCAGHFIPKSQRRMRHWFHGPGVVLVLKGTVGEHVPHCRSAPGANTTRALLGTI